ncbi:MAG: GDSL-type esterase/lipase family protein [Sulfurimonas sp.]
MSKTTAIAIFLALIIVGAFFFKENKQNNITTISKKDAVILAFGDSLTYGYGVDQAFSYPSKLKEKLGVKVINAGVSGEESSEGLKRLAKFLKEKPDIVILCHGGNDILRKHSMQVLKKNLLTMVDMIEKSGAIVILVGVPDFSYKIFSPHSLYAEVAKEKHIIYEDKILPYIELRRNLKSDYIHPNEKGYEMMAETFSKIIYDNDILSN